MSQANLHPTQQHSDVTAQTANEGDYPIAFTDPICLTEGFTLQSPQDAPLLTSIYISPSLADTPLRIL
jgi:hypothetical protein